MEYTAKITAEDYLNYHLFTASNSHMIKAVRRKNRILVIVGFLFLAFVFYRYDRQIMMYLFMLLALVTTFLFPKYAQWYYMQHFRKLINKTYRDNFGEVVSIVFMPEQLIINGHAGKTIIDAADLEETAEIQSCYFLKTASGDALIIPKNGLNDPAGFERELYDMIGKFNIYHNKDLNWTWK